MPNAQTILGLLDRLQSDYIHVNQYRCAVVRNRNATCMRCAEACTSGCISLQDGELVVSPEKCIGCGTCATVCPTCALEAHHPDDAKLFVSCTKAMEKNDGHAVIACRNFMAAARGLVDVEKVAEVACLGRVEESLLVMLATLGATRITLVATECASCPFKAGCDTAKAVCSTVSRLLDTWNHSIEVSVSEKFPRSVRLASDKGYDPDRRAFFRSVKSTTRVVSTSTAAFAVDEALGVVPRRAEPVRYVRVQADKTLPHFLPARRRRLVEGLKTLGSPRDEMIETRLWGHVVIDPDRCNSCLMCATFCPTEAIKKYRQPDGTFGIEHYPGRCVKCRCCTDICNQDALTLCDDVQASDVTSDLCERYQMRPLDFEPGNLKELHTHVGKLIGVEEVYDH